MSDVTIRKAEIEDAAALPDIERAAGAAFRSIAGLEWIADDEVMSAKHHALCIDEGTVWVAESEGPLVGFVTARVESDENSLHIIELSVASGQQGRGIGRRLMQAAVNLASSNGMASLTLTTFRDLAFNEKFYQKLGFRTLEVNELTPRLRDILQEEVKNGLPAERRCAMSMRL